MGDDKLAKICADIYAKHQKALDLIFENKPDRSSILAEIIHSWAENKTKEGELEYVSDKSGKTYTRFKTETMSRILPDAQNASSGWKTKNYYFYEIRNNEGSKFFIQFAVSSKDIPSDLRAVCNRINEFSPSRTQKDNWQWRIHFTSKTGNVDEEMSEDKIFKSLDNMYEQVKEFENKLEGYLNRHSAVEN